MYFMDDSILAQREFAHLNDDAFWKFQDDILKALNANTKIFELATFRYLDVLMSEENQTRWEIFLQRESERDYP